MTDQSDSSTLSPAPALRGKALLSGLLLAVTLHAVAELAIAVALPLISRELDGVTLYGAAIAAYLLGSIVSLVWSGHMTDARGPSLPFISGLTVFAIGNIIAAAAQSMETLVFARFVQGLGGGAFSAVVYASVNKTWGPGERPRILAFLSAAWILPGLIAPMAAGAIAEFWSWRWIFLILLPLTLITGLLAAKGLRAIKPGSVEQSGAHKVVMATLLAIGVTLILAAISREVDWLSWILLALGLAIAWKPFQSILPPGEGQQRRFLYGALAVKFMLVFAFFGADAFLPLALIDIHGLTAFMAGLVLTLASLSWSGAAFFQSAIAARYSPHNLVIGGLVVITLSLAGLLPLLSPGVSPYISYVAWTLGGAGIGLAWNTLSASAMTNTLPGKEGATSTASGLAEALAVALSSGIGGAIINYGERNALDLGFSIGAIWGLCILIMVLGMGLTWAWVERRAPITAKKRGVHEPAE